MDDHAKGGYLVIGDISGYTSYVATTELTHSQEVLAELLSLIVEQFQPVLTIQGLEGDAVWGNAPGDAIPRGETLVELLETTYTAFRDHVRGIVLRTTCECEACRAIPTLDLKFIVHFGEYVEQNISGRKELVGTEVNRFFRLTKNHVTEETGWNAYILYTEPSLEQIGIGAEGMHESAESYEHLGEIKTYVVDLHQRFQEIADARHIVLEEKDAHGVMDYEFDAPPAVVWAWLNDPVRRNRIDPSNYWSAELRPGGRTRSGATNHCAHGKNNLTCETILDWRPFQYVTQTTTTADLPYKLFDHMATIALEPIDGGQRTHVQWRFKMDRFPGPLAKLTAKAFMKSMRRNMVEPLDQAMAEAQEEQPSIALSASG